MACALGIEQDCNECRMCGNGKDGKNMTNFEWIKGMSVEKFAELSVSSFTYMSGYRADTLFRGHNGIDYSTREEAVMAELEWLESECDAE